MNYKKLHDAIIKKAQIRNYTKKDKKRLREESRTYLEQHHIIPRCIEKNESEENKVYLLLREHFIIHKLLIKIYPDSRKLKTAFHFMVYGHQSKCLNLTSRDFEYAKRLCVESKKGVKLSKDHRKKLSIARRKRICTEETKEKLRGKIPWNKGKTTPLKTRLKQSAIKKGKPSPRKGSKHSLETKEKLRIINTGKKHSLETIEKLRKIKKNCKKVIVDDMEYLSTRECAGILGINIPVLKHRIYSSNFPNYKYKKIN